MDEETVSQREDADAVNGTSTPEQKAYPHPIAIVSAGRQSFLFPPTMVPLRPTPQSMSSLPPPCLTQASLYYSTHYIPAQQFSLGTQGSFLTAMPPLLQMQANNVPTERTNDTKMEMEIQENIRKRKSSEDSEPVSFQLSPISHHSMSSGGSLEDQHFKLEESSPCRMENSPPHTPASSSATSPMSPSTINALSPVNELCGICGDKATGHHYGVPSCEGCKGFFKRSVQNKKTYTCRNLTKDCPMDKRQRNRCQYCRFQKCLEAGMLKEAVREDRAPGGRHKSSLVNIKSVGQPPCKQPKKSVSDLLPSKVSALASVPKPTPPPLPDLIQEIVNCNSQHTISNEQCLGCKETELKEKTLAHVTQLAEQQLVRSSSWFDQLVLLKDISTTDQETLIRNCWVELMLANLIKQSQDLEDKAMLCKEQILDYETAETTGIGDIMQRVVQMATKFRELKLDNVEFVCMKIIVLLNPDVVALQNQLQVENLQDRFHTALQNYITTNSPKDTNRFGNILLRLPELRSIGTKSIERLFMLNLTGQIHPSYSLSELLHSSKR